MGFTDNKMAKEEVSSLPKQASLPKTPTVIGEKKSMREWRKDLWLKSKASRSRAEPTGCGYFRCSLPHPSLSISLTQTLQFFRQMIYLRSPHINVEKGIKRMAIAMRTPGWLLVYAFDNFQVFYTPALGSYRRQILISYNHEVYSHKACLGH